MFLEKEESKGSPEKLTRKYFWGRCHLKFFSKRGKALEYFGFDVSAAVFPSSPEKADPSGPSFFLPAAPTLVLSFIQMFLKKEEGEVSPEKLTRKYFWGRGHLNYFPREARH
jgi:hypothetical protein